MLPNAPRGATLLLFPPVSGCYRARVSTNPVYSLFATPGTLAPFFLRMALAVLFFYHGMQMTFGWFGGDGWNKTMEIWTSSDALTLSYAMVAALLVTELTVAVSLFFGFLTRLAAFAVVIIMAGWLFSVRGGATFAQVELPLLTLATGLALAGLGGGRFSVDRAISANLLPNVG